MGEEVKPGYRPLTEEEAAVQQAEAMVMRKDFAAILRRDPAAPFATLQDAVVNLVPYHVSGRALTHARGATAAWAAGAGAQRLRRPPAAAAARRHTRPKRRHASRSSPPAPPFPLFLTPALRQRLQRARPRGGARRRRCRRRKRAAAG